MQRGRIVAEGGTLNGTDQGRVDGDRGGRVRGGVGSTSLAVNLGCTLAQDPSNTVALIDLDLALGDADVALDLMPDYTLADVALNIDRLDMTFLRRSLSKHSSGLSLLPHPVQMEDVGLIHEDHLQRVIGLLRASYTHLILDLSKGFTPTDLTALRMADMILLVGQLELTSLRNAVRMLLTLGADEAGRQGEGGAQPGRLGRRHQPEEGGGNHRQADLLAGAQRFAIDDRVAQRRRAAVAARSAQQDPTELRGPGAGVSGKVEAPAPVKKSRVFFVQVGLGSACRMGRNGRQSLPY